jgi:uncharacterized protein (DUF885 family)
MLLQAKTFAAAILLGGFLAACQPAGPKAPTTDEIAANSAALTEYLDAEFEEELQQSPEWMTRLGRKDRYGELTDRSEQAEDELLEWRRQSVADMKAKFSYDGLDEAARDSWNLWISELDRDETSAKFRRHRLQFVRGGVHTSLPNFLLNFHKVDDAADMAAYVSRVNKIANAMDQTIEKSQLAAQDGIRAPRFAYERAISEMKAVISGQPFTETGPDSPLWADAKAKIAKLKEDGKLPAPPEDGSGNLGIDRRDEAALTYTMRETLKSTLRPSYERAIAWLESDIDNAPTEAVGAGARPGGADFYNAALKLQTTTDMTADEIHELGLSEVARIRAEMEAIKQQVGFEGSLQDFFVYMRTEPRFYLPNTDAGREQYLQASRDYLAGMTAKLPEYFGILPKAGLEVRRVEAFREEPGGAQHYNSGAPDGSRPGVFYAHLSDMQAMPTYQLENIAYHEGVPGHHMQISIAQELTGLPKFRTQYGYTAFSEGWGLYSEALGKEMGFYTDPYSDFGRLAGEIWRAIRLVVDTGIHAKGWTEEEAVAYFLENSPQPEAAIRSEIRRYIVNPGQATCYKIGMIRIQKLRDEAKAELGDTFDYRAFHDTVLGGGSLPMPVLEERVKRWIETTKAAG